MRKFVAVIPARMGSSRLPGKPLKKILGLPLVAHCYYRTGIAVGLENTYIATCDSEIFNFGLSIGANCVMTSPHHDRCTGRVAEALGIIEEELGETIENIIMVQGDEALIPPSAIVKTFQFFDNPEVDVVNVMSRISDREVFEDVNNVKVVTDCSGDALYFSRACIPNFPEDGFNSIPKFMQTGVIAFSRELLLNFNSMVETPLEIAESIDINRLLESGYKVKMVAIEDKTLGVDTKKDVTIAERLLASDSVTREYLEF